MTTEIKNPFSGDVSQVINPLQWWGEMLNGNSTSNSLINITNYKSSNHRAEKRIIEEVAGYGKQLGRMMEVMELLLSLHEGHDFSDKQNRVIDEFLEVSERVKKIKEEELLHTYSLENVERMVEGLEKLKVEQPYTYQGVAERLKTVLD